MKVRVSYSVDVNDTMRRKMREYYGQDGLATENEVQLWYEMHGHSKDDDLQDVFTNDEKDVQ